MAKEVLIYSLFTVAAVVIGNLVYEKALKPKSDKW